MNWLNWLCNCLVIEWLWVSTLAENKLISLFLLKYLWSECERVGKPWRQWGSQGSWEKQTI